MTDDIIIRQASCADLAEINSIYNYCCQLTRKHDLIDNGLISVFICRKCLNTHSYFSFHEGSGQGNGGSGGLIPLSPFLCHCSLAALQSVGGQADLLKKSDRIIPYRTESLAVGNAGFVEKIKPLLLSRGETEVIQTADGLTVLQESPVPYGQKSGSKNGA